jgi:hypothetical protein
LPDLAKLELPANLFPGRPELGPRRGDDHAEAVSAPASGASRSQFLNRSLFSGRKFRRLLRLRLLRNRFFRPGS